jgi:hypothetical protein
VQDVAAASGEADQGGVVFLAFGPLAVVVGAADRISPQRREGAEEERSLEVLVP